MSLKRSRAAYESGGRAHHRPASHYGTALRAGTRFVPEWKQEVTDERGRRLFHGAFKGGWSAGYNNTVGSKEGFTPSTFVSSRTNRAKDQDGGDPRAQRVEDFMDDEDLAEQAESQQLETQAAFAGLGDGSAEGVARGMFADLFQGKDQRSGVLLAERMGWRQRQGVGPKLWRRAQGDKHGDFHQFAPEDPRIASWEEKSDRKGMGLVGQSSLRRLSAQEDDGDEVNDVDARILRPGRSKVSKAPKSIKKPGFGLGVRVLNGDGSDDEDAYSIGPRISYNRVIGPERKKKPGGLDQSIAVPTVIRPGGLSRRSAHQTAMARVGLRKCHDGRLPLEGFILSSALLMVTLEHEIPWADVSVDWIPSKQQSADRAGVPAHQSTAQVAQASKLDPKTRGALLGEQQLPGKSIFDFISAADRDRLAAATGKANLPPGRGERVPEGPVQPGQDRHRNLWSYVPNLDKETAAMALQRAASGWMPYAEDSEKRARYRYFLELSVGQHSNLPERSPVTPLEEWVKELREFSDAAQVFKPVSTLMARRFVSASDTPRLASDAPDAAPAPAPKEEDPADKAAKLGMYGPLTRSREPFFPTRLLCKRFNVKPPANTGVDPEDAPGADGKPAGSRFDLVSQVELDRMVMHANWKRPDLVSHGTQGGSEDTGGPTTATTAAKVDADNDTVLETVKPEDSLFKDVFGSDDESD